MTLLKGIHKEFKFIERRDLNVQNVGYIKNSSHCNYFTLQIFNCELILLKS